MGSTNLITKQIPVFNSSLIQPIMSFARQQGICLVDALERMHLSQDLQENRNMLVPVKPVWEFLDYIQCKEKMPDIGFQIARGNSVLKIPGIGENLVDCETLSDLLNGFIRLSHRVSHVTRLSLRRSRENVWFCRKPMVSGVGSWVIEQGMVLYMIELVQKALGPDWWPDRIELVHDREMGNVESRWLVYSQVRTGRSCTAIRLPLMALRLTVHLGDFKRTPERSFRAPSDVHSSLDVCMDHFMGREDLKLKAFCQLLGVSSRTLQRRLKDEGTTYQQVLDRARIRHAKLCLQNRELGIADISRTLGYQSPAAFTRAFHRCTGLSPTAYRSTH